MSATENQASDSKAEPSSAEEGRSKIANRFRGFLPAVIDVETGGFNAKTDALLEIAVVLLRIDDSGYWGIDITRSTHVEAFPGANIEAEALEFNRIIPDHPLRDAKPEKEALHIVLDPVRKAVRAHGCTRAVLVGHNPAFDISFLNEAVKRCGFKRNPFHPFSTFDTATLGGLAFGQTVLARAVQAAGIEWDSREAHSAIYDARKTAELFCHIVNLWDHRP
ncbi:ribonuclease T [Thioalkalivibrio sp. HK1]|uniref:ribonuclease T n=1 Tax=Thioalkalivibrio sp. HK1 TaxID=1469245 RepID=UPI00046F38F4|nr:ribonuclease T [Thioalkalivibrio sp. HK1]